MPTFKYSAQSRNGETIKGVVEAYDELAAVERVKENYPIVNSIVEIRHKESILNMEIGSGKIGLKDLSIMCSQFAIILDTGMPIAKATEMISTQTRDKKLKKLLHEVAKDVMSGYSLADSLENKGGKKLPVTFIETVRAGEDSGSLGQSFAKLETYYKNEAEVRGKVTSAIAYPAFLLVLAVTVILVVLVVAIPTFSATFKDLGIEMPALTQWLIDLAEGLKKNWWIILLVIFVIAAAYYVYDHTDQGHLNISKWKTKLPVIGEVITMKSSSQLANTMSTLLAAGLPLINAVDITSRVMENYYMGKQLNELVLKLQEGNMLGESMELYCNAFPPLLKQMITMGEETGSLEETLSSIGKHFDNEVDISTKRALGILQPALIMGIGAIIAVIVVALYLPMFSMYGGIG